jgi:hypothetical protein
MQAAVKMRGMFISYRRSDSQGSSGRLFDRLVAAFGTDHIFMDVDSIDPGAHFPTVLSSKLAESDVLVAVIGPHWLGREATGISRLDDPADFVHQEIAGALERGIHVVPVLVEEAVMPDAGRLPPALARISELQAVEVRHTRFGVDVQGLIETLRRALAEADGARRSQPLPLVRAWLREVLGEPTGMEDIIFGVRKPR